MSIPTAVETVLNQHQINYGLTETPPLNESNVLISKYKEGACAARCIILADDKGQLQAIVPADRLLDIAELNKITGEPLKLFLKMNCNTFSNLNNCTPYRYCRKLPVSRPWLIKPY